MTDRVVGPLRDLREPLHAGLSTLQVAASAVTTAEPLLARKSLEGALAFLQEQFLPMCRAEESTIFTAIEEAAGWSDACAVTKAEHTSIIRMAGDLAQVVEAAKADGDVARFAEYLHPLLYGLYALCRVHLESEDEAYLRVLDFTLTEAQVAQMAETLSRLAAVGAEQARPE